MRIPTESADVRFPHRQLMSNSFKDLAAFRRALELVSVIYEVTPTFPKQEMYGLTSQMPRAALGVMSHIAEGRGRLTYGEYRQFLTQSRGSLFEVEAQCLAGRTLGFLDEQGHARIQEKVAKTASALAGLIRWVLNKEKARKPDSQTARKPFTGAQPADPRNRQARPPET
jgi:four helix bundle protein